MLGNFAFLFSPTRISEYGEQFAQNCDELEQLYASGFYTSCVSKCRACCETLVKRIYQEDIYEVPQIIAEKNWQYCNYYELINANGFIRAVGNPRLIKELDQARLEAGNIASHDMEKTFDQRTALRHLSLFHELLLNYEYHVFEYPVQKKFFEPFFDEPIVPEEEPIIRDYPALMQQAHDAGDQSLAAKWAFLNWLNVSDFDISPWIEGLPEHSDILNLIRLICNQEQLRDALGESSVRLSMLVSKCFGDFHWSEVDAVVYTAVMACRGSVIDELKTIADDLKSINRELEGLHHGQ